ncbi:MAG: translation initiation factor IF-3 [bacterium]
MSKEVRVNRRIRVPQVRVIGSNGEQLGVFATDEAIRMAENEGLDLVEIASNATPPVCKIIDYGKFKYQAAKKQQEAKKHQTVIHVKEVKLRPTTDDHDFDFKVRHIIRFLEHGDKAKVTVTFKGREMAYAAQGRAMLERVIEAIKETAVVEMPPRMEGRNMFMIVTPKGK